MVKGGDATPFMITPSAAQSRSPGMGKMDCCECNHVKLDTNGVRQAMPCKKDKLASIVLRLLQSRREYHYGRDEHIDFRWWTAVTSTIMKGLPRDGMPKPPGSVSEFLNQNRFHKPDDETHSTGWTPLVFASLSGNAIVVNELINRHCVNVKARVLIAMGRYGAESGTDALGAAAAFCPQGKVFEIIGLLLAAGADPNSTYASGGTPLMAAVMWHSLDGVHALIKCVGDNGGKLDLEKGLKINKATALLVAANVSTFEIINALVDAGANREHK